MNLTIFVGKEGASAARWKGAFLGMTQEISEKCLELYWKAMQSRVSKAGTASSSLFYKKPKDIILMLELLLIRRFP
jgi:hypothetical protein